MLKRLRARQAALAKQRPPKRKRGVLATSSSSPNVNASTTTTSDDAGMDGKVKKHRSSLDSSFQQGVSSLDSSETEASGGGATTTEEDKEETLPPGKVEVQSTTAQRQKTARAKGRGRGTGAGVIAKMREEQERRAAVEAARKREAAVEEQRKKAAAIYPEGTKEGDRVRSIFYTLSCEEDMPEFALSVQRLVRSWVDRLRQAEARFLCRERARTDQQIRESRFTRSGAVKCYDCGAPERAFIEDKKGGDMVCTACGLVLSGCRTGKGDMYRSFEGENDRSHHEKSKVDPRLREGMTLGNVVTGTNHHAKSIRSMAHEANRVSGGRIGGRWTTGTTVSFAESEKRRYIHALSALAPYSIVPRCVVERAKWISCRARDALESVSGVRPMLTASVLLALEEFGEEPRRRYVCTSCHKVFEEEKLRNTHNRMCEIRRARERHWDEMEEREKRMRQMEAKRRKVAEKKYGRGLFL